MGRSRTNAEGCLAPDLARRGEGDPPAAKRVGRRDRPLCRPIIFVTRQSASLQDRHLLASSCSRPYRESMNLKIICLLAAASLALSSTVFGAGAKTYQIKGTVVAMTGSKITV